MNMTKQQQQAVEYFRTHLTGNLNTNPEYGDTIAEFKVDVSEHGITYVSAKTAMLGLPEGNLLRALSSEYWLAFIGKRGAITLKMGPKSYKQFNGRRAFRMNIEMR